MSSGVLPYSWSLRGHRRCSDAASTCPSEDDYYTDLLTPDPQVAGKFFPLDIDMGADSEEMQKLSAKDSKSKLAKPIQVCLPGLLLRSDSLPRSWSASSSTSSG